MEKNRNITNTCLFFFSSMDKIIHHQFVLGWCTVQCFCFCIFLINDEPPLNPLVWLPSWGITMFLLFFIVYKTIRNYKRVHVQNVLYSYSENFAVFYHFWMEIIGIVTITLFWIALYAWSVHAIDLVFPILFLLFGSLSMFVVGMIPRVLSRVEYTVPLPDEGQVEH